jgi:hypothetical protein
MNSRFKFPRRVRIHGGECGAVARALHHKAKINSLPAVSENVSFTTNERKQMSTKITLKRVALVAVSALGFGMLTVAPSFAATPSLSLAYSSVTVVGSPEATGTQGIGTFKFGISDAADGARALASTEQVVVSVVSAPAAFTDTSGATVTPTIADLSVLEVKSRILATIDTANAQNATFANTNNNCTDTDGPTVLGSEIGQYCFSVTPAITAANLTRAYGYGEYTLRVRLQSTSGVVYSDTTAKIRFVRTASESNAVISGVAQVGSLAIGDTLTATANKHFTATLRDANGGRIQNGDTATAGARIPLLTSTIFNTLDEGSSTSLTSYDSYTSGQAWLTDYGSESSFNSLNGVYLLVPQVPGSGLASGLSTTTAPTLTVRYGNATAVTASVTMLVAGSTHPSNSTRTVTAADAYTTNESVTAAGDWTYKVPLTTTSAKIEWTLRNSAGTVLANEPVSVTTTWTGHNAGAVSPLSGASNAQTLKSDALGKLSLTLTQSNPLNGSKAVVSVTGQASGAGAFGSTTFDWGVSAVTTLVTSPNADFQATAAASTSVTVTALDQFRKPMSGVVIQPGISGSTSANYTATAKATLTTGADGSATYTVTGGAAAKTDTFTFTAAAGTVSAASVKATYIAALPVIATLTGTYSTSQSEATTTATVTSGVYSGLFSTTAISSTDPIAVDITKNYGNTWTLSTSTSDTGYKFRVLAKDSAGAIVAGMPVTVTGSDNAWFTDSCTGASALLVQSKTCYTNSAGYVHVSVIAVGAGTPTVTFTAGSVTASQAIATKVAANSARTIALTGDATGTAYKRGGMTVKVTDRFGNAVSDISVLVTTSGVGSLSGGAKTGTYTTDVNGQFSIVLESNDAGTTTVTARQTTANDSESSAGFQGVNFIGSVFGAEGVRTISANLIWAAGIDPAVAAANAATAAAEAATDAAAEAIDAANAATDAANLSAEAADAATVAAEEARDAADAATAAVEELATQVATLMAALKAQITTLANTVAKIAKKVKA